MDRPDGISGGTSHRAALSGGILLGVGLGGFVDGIALHQILQWHHMLSTVLPPTTMDTMRTNMLWDGLFHAFVWAFVLAGVLLVWKDGRQPSPLPPAAWLIGLLLVGWGLFNFVEGIVNHHLLGLHHVRRYGPAPLWDIGFVLSGPVLAALGLGVARGKADHGAAPESRRSARSRG